MKPDSLQIVTIYILVMYMTQNYHKLLDEKKLEIVKVTIINIACFHEKNFLRSTAKAPTNDLMALQLTFQLIDQDIQVMKDMAIQLHDSVRRQSWYLASPLVYLAVADDEISSDEKLKILKKLLNFEVPTNEELQAAEPRLPKNYLLTAQAKRIDFVNSQSYMLFKAFKFNKDNLSQ